MRPRPFFSFYGGKWRTARRYPLPVHDTIVEPFAGSAGFATWYYRRRVILVERDPVIAGLWRYLVRVSPAEVLALPPIVECVDDVPGPPGARALVGFWLNAATSRPRNVPGKWMRSAVGRSRLYWGPGVRTRIASQVEQIRHWEILEGDYSIAPDVEATWFIDPPYEDKGRHYRHGSRDIDFAALGEWARARRGQVIACENVGASWLPFEPAWHAKSARGRSREAIWTNGPRIVQPNLFGEVET